MLKNLSSVDATRTYHLLNRDICIDHGSVLQLAVVRRDEQCELKAAQLLQLGGFGLRVVLGLELTCVRWRQWNLNNPPQLKL